MEKFLQGSIRVLMMALIVSMMVSCSDDDDETSSNPAKNPLDYKTPKYIFFFIGDGMATPQINLAQAALNDPDFRPKSSVGIGQMRIAELPIIGMSTTHAENRYITGSAASATALATGEKTTINTISKSGDYSRDLRTMAEMARDKGMRVGVVSSVSIDHATPAAFYAHENTRKSMYNISAQMATAKFDYYGGGYAHGDRDGDGYKDIKQKMQNEGYKIVSNRADFNAIQNGEKVWAYNHTLDASSALWYEMDRPADHLSLAEFTQRGIEILDNDKGFFMMVEGGKIDWACHANDAVAAAYDMIAFDDALGKALDFYKQHPDETLIIVTGDHECGGLALGFANTAYETAFDILKYQKLSYEKFTEKVYEWIETQGDAFTFEVALEKIKENFGLGNAALNEALALSEYELDQLRNAFNKTVTGESPFPKEDQSLFYDYYDPLTVTVTHILNRKAGIDWTSYYHTGVPVPVFAIGQGQYEFSGFYDNTDVAKKIMTIGSLK
jgi:alkaline phosphatase